MKMLFDEFLREKWSYPPCIFIFYGKEPFFKQKCINNIQEYLTEYTISNCSFSEVKQELLDIGIFDENKLIIVNNLKDVKELTPDYLKKINSNKGKNYIIYTVDTDKIAESAMIYDINYIACPALEQKDIIAWVQAYTRKYNFKASYEQIRYILKNLKTLQDIENFLQVLACYLNGKSILTEQDIQYWLPNAEARYGKIWERLLTDTFSLEDLQVFFSNINIFGFVSFMSNRIMLLYKYQYLKALNKTEDEIMKGLNIQKYMFPMLNKEMSFIKDYRSIMSKVLILDIDCRKGATESEIFLKIFQMFL